MDLIGKIYEAIEDDEVLNALPDLISAEIGARSCTLQQVSADFVLEGMWLNHFDEPMVQFYREHEIHRYDEWTKTNLGKIGLNKTARHSDYLSLQGFCQSFFYNEFIRKFGDDSAHCAGFISQRPDGGYVVIGLQKGRTDCDFTAEQVSRHDALRPHVTRMMVLRTKLACLIQASSGALMGIDSVEDAYLLVRSDRTVLFANAAAEELLRSGELLALCNGRMYLLRPVEDDRLVHAIHNADHATVEGSLSFAAQDRGGLVWRFTVAPKQLDGNTLIQIWIEDGSVAKCAAQRLQRIYGLTSAEVPVLMAVCDGLTAAEIADRMSIAVATVRTHQQHIYQKMGVNKATQLTRLVATLPKA